MKKNGFVFMETIIVMSVLSITLLLLFSSYSYILRKSRTKSVYDTTEFVYKTYYVKKTMMDVSGTVEGYAGSRLSGECSKQTYGSYYSYMCDLSSDSYTGALSQVKLSFEVDKIYILNPYQVLSSSSQNEWLNNFDATTIDYIRNIGLGTNKTLLIVKYKKKYASTSKYEVYHASTEV